jgi:hypothetical protein
MKLSFVSGCSFIKGRLATQTDAVYIRRLSQSALEALFGEIRSYSRGTGLITFARYRERMGSISLRKESAIIKKTGHTHPSCLLKRKRQQSAAPVNAAAFKSCKVAMA